MKLFTTTSPLRITYDSEADALSFEFVPSSTSARTVEVRPDVFLDLDRQGALDDRIDGRVDDRHAAAAEFALDPVLAYVLWWHADQAAADAAAVVDAAAVWLTGRVTRKRVPTPTTDSTSSLPPWLSTIR